MVAYGNAGAVRSDRGNPEIKLQRMCLVRDQVMDELNRDRVASSQSCNRIIQYTKSTSDYMLPSSWGDREKHEDPYNPQVKDSCCTIS
ncbi:GGL domain-containing protein [Lipomyces oligophaga]|uniref:GGL domain-containing protein n=1 Tax=Lipomyces oligophaga TaxID=45792 RepID=UPI0034CFE7F1